MTADFSHRFVLPPGISAPPSVAEVFPQPTWKSPDLDPDSPHLMAGGSTVWVETEPVPAAIVASHPNSWGGAEDLFRLATLAEKYQAEAWVMIDPLLLGKVSLPPPLRPAVAWREAQPEQLELWGERVLQAADALRRRLRQVPGLRFPVLRPAGRTVTVLAPMPADTILVALQRAGVVLPRPLRWWAGIVSMTVNWWHTRAQIDGLATVLAQILAGRDPDQVPADDFRRVPDDLPRRQLNNIKAHLKGER